MEQVWGSMKSALSRRSFLRNGTSTVGSAVVGAGFLSWGSDLHADQGQDQGRLTRGDAAMLRFAAAAEILETDFWVQYNELGGVQDQEEPSGTGNPAYTMALSVLDSDMAQYVRQHGRRIYPPEFLECVS